MTMRAEPLLDDPDAVEEPTMTEDQAYGAVVEYVAPQPPPPVFASIDTYQQMRLSPIPEASDSSNNSDHGSNAPQPEISEKARGRDDSLTPVPEDVEKAASVRSAPRTLRAEASKRSINARDPVTTPTDAEKATLNRQRSYCYEELAQNNPKATDHLSITLGGPVILLLDLIVPCIVYYTWYINHGKTWRRECRAYTDQDQICPLERPQFDKDILGYAIICFGFGELYILITRVGRLFFHCDQCAPLLSRSKWELDATSWVYAVAMIVALMPFLVGSSLEMPIVYLYSPSCLMAFLGILMLVTFIPFPIPIGINSQARGTPLRPFIYYAAEDFIAVDGLQDRGFRVRYNARWAHSKNFRFMFRMLTLWWLFGVCAYIGSASAIIWTVDFHLAFGLTLGVLFAWIAVWAIVTYVWVRLEMAKERRQYEETGHC